MPGNFCFAFLSLFLTAGGCVLLLLVLLAGTRDWDPFNRIYFIWADTSGIPGAPATSEWTLWNICESSAGKIGGITTKCGETFVAHPFLPQQNFGTTKGVPADFLNNPKTYYYLSRFAFAFYLISLFFMLASMVSGILALCSRLGSALSAVASFWAFFCVLTLATMMTAVFTLGRTTFHEAKINAGIGYYAFGFTWGAVGCMLFSSIFYCMGFNSARRNRYHERHIEAEKRDSRGSFQASRHH